MLPTPGWPRARATGHRGPGRRVGAQRLPAAPAAGAERLSRSLPRTPSLPALTQQDASWPGHPASPPAPAHRLPGPAASAEPAPLRRWQGHPVRHRVSCVGTASPAAPSPALRVSVISAPAGVSGRFGSRTQRAAAEPASATVSAGLGDVFWQGHGGESSQSPTKRRPRRGPLGSGPCTARHTERGMAPRGTAGYNWLGPAQSGEPQLAQGPSPPALAPALAPASGVNYTQRDLALNLLAEQR